MSRSVAETVLVSDSGLPGVLDECDDDDDDDGGGGGGGCGDSGCGGSSLPFLEA